MQSLKEWREFKGVKQVAVARYLGISRQTYAKYEVHPELMSIAQAKRLCEYLNCDMKLILEASGS